MEKRSADERTSDESPEQETAEGVGAKDELSDSEALDKHLLETFPDPVAVLQDDQYRFVNPAFTRVFGYTRQDVAKSLSFFQLVQDNDEKTVRQRRQDRPAGEQTPLTFDIDLIAKDGTLVPCELAVTTIRYRGHPGDLVVIRDISKHKQAEAALRESEGRFRNLAEHSPNMIFINKGGKVVYANRKCMETMGYTRQEFYSPGFDFMTLIVPSSRGTVNAAYADHTAGKEIPPYEYSLVTKDGKTLQAMITTKLIEYEGEQAVLGIVADITERENTEKAIRESEERYRTLFQSAYDAILVMDGEYFVNCNQMTSEIFGCAKTQIVGQPPCRFFPPQQPDGRDSEEKMKEKINAALGGQPQFFEWRYCRYDGTAFDAEVSLNKLALSEEAYILAIVRDITERKRDEKSLRENERLLSSMFASIQDGISILDTDLTVRHVNPVMNRWYAANAPLEGKKCYQCYHGTARPCDPCPTLRCIQSGETEREIVPGLPGSSVEWVELFSYPIKDRDTGRVTGIAEFVRDITDRKRAENELKEHRDRLDELVRQRTAKLSEVNEQLQHEIAERKEAEKALRESEEKNRTFLYNLGDVAYETDDQGNLVYANKAAEAATGFQLSEIVGKPFLPLFKDESKKTAIDVYQRTLKGESPEYELTLNNGKVLRFRNEPRRARDGKITGVFGVARDITECKRAEEALERKIAQLNSFINNIPDMAWLKDADSRFIAVNRAFGETVGIAPESLVNQTCEVCFGKAQAKKFREDDRAVMKDGKQVIVEEMILDSNKNGVWLETIKSPILDESGKVAGTVGIAREITKRKQMMEELRLHRDHLDTLVVERTAELRAEREELNKKNSALRQILEHIEEGRREYRQKICRDIEQVIMPALTQLHEKVDPSRAGALDALQNNLSAILAKDVDSFRQRYLKLTPRELEICDMIKDGLTSKEISESLSLSLLTVHKHRETIRKKLEITNKHVNLSTYLRVH